MAKLTVAFRNFSNAPKKYGEMEVSSGKTFIPNFMLNVLLTVHHSISV
jgi:hypothetical protein